MIMDSDDDLFGMFPTAQHAGLPAGLPAAFLDPCGLFSDDDIEDMLINYVLSDDESDESIESRSPRSESRTGENVDPGDLLSSVECSHELERKSRSSLSARERDRRWVFQISHDR
jgi:hypothetical protein